MRYRAQFIQQQIDEMVARAVDKALAERQAKMDAAVNKQSDVITGPQSTAQTPDMAIPFGINFSGYARYGAHYQGADQKYVAVVGSYHGASAIGRPGNESNGGEFQLSKAFKGFDSKVVDGDERLKAWQGSAQLQQ